MTKFANILSTGDSLICSLNGVLSSSSTTSIAVDIDSVSEGTISSSLEGFLGICPRLGVVEREIFVGVGVRSSSAKSKKKS